MTGKGDEGSKLDAKRLVRLKQWEGRWRDWMVDQNGSSLVVREVAIPCLPYCR